MERTDAPADAQPHLERVDRCHTITDFAHEDALGGSPEAFLDHRLQVSIDTGVELQGVRDADGQLSGVLNTCDPDLRRNEPDKRIHERGFAAGHAADQYHILPVRHGPRHHLPYLGRAARRHIVLPRQYLRLGHTNTEGRRPHAWGQKAFEAPHWTT